MRCGFESRRLRETGDVAELVQALVLNTSDKQKVRSLERGQSLPAAHGTSRVRLPAAAPDVQHAMLTRA